MKKLTDNLRAGSLPDPTARAPARGALFHRCGGQSRERTVWPMTPTQNWSFPLLVWGQWGVLHRHLTTRSLAFHLCPITQKKPEKGHPLCVSDERAEAWNPGRHLVRRKEVGREPPARDIPGPKWGPETSFASFSLCFRWPGGHLFLAPAAKLVCWLLPFCIFWKRPVSLQGLHLQCSCSAQLPFSACFPITQVLSSLICLLMAPNPLGSTRSPQSLYAIMIMK